MTYVFNGKILVWLRFYYRNLSKHGVSSGEVVECFENRKKIVRHAAKANWLIASTQSGRLLEIGYVIEKANCYYVFHAMDARNYQRKQYKRRAK
jgi:uncharacterized DUF497 family protein